jgi:hypothetical protein
MSEVITEDRREPNGRLVLRPEELDLIAEKVRSGGDDGARTRDLRRDRPAF